MSLRNTSYFNPTSVGGCSLWLDGADTSSSSMTLTGNTVNTWKDKSGNGYNYTQTSYSTTLPPLSNIATGTGVYFGSQQGLYNTTFPFPTSYTIFAIANQITNSGSYQYILHSPYNADYIIFFGSLNGNFATFTGSGGWNDVNANSPSSGIATTSNTASILCCTNNGTTLTPYFNSVAMSTKTGTNAAATGMTLGDTDTAHARQPWLGTVGEIIIYNSVIGTTQRQQIEGYLAWKWGLTASLPINHPYAVTPSYGLPSIVPNATFKLAGTNINHPVLAISGCALWLDPVNPNSLTLSGTDVISIQDSSPLRNNASRFNGSAYATALTVSGNRILSFPGANITYRCPLVLSGAAYTIFTVSSLLSTTGNGSGYQRILNADNGGGYIFVGSFNGDLATFCGTNGFNDINANTPAYTLTGNGLQIITMYVSGSTLIPYINGTAQTTKVGTTGAATSVLDIGAYQNSSQNWNGYIGDIIIYSNALSTDQRQTIEGFLAQKWSLTANLPAGHPHKSSMPLYPSPFTTGLRRIAGRRWSPLTPGGCGLWLDASDISTLFQDSAGTIAVTSGGQPIGLWRDKSGLARDFSQASSGNRVSYDTSSKGALQLSSPTYLQASAASLGTVSTSANLTIIMTASTGPSASWQIILAQWFTGTSRFHLSFQSGTDLTPNLRSASTGTELSYPMSGTMAYNRTYTIGFIANGTSLYMSFMGTSNTTTMSAALSTNPTSAITIADSRNANLTDGKIQEIIIYPSAISTTTFQQAEGYLAWKWGLNASLPSSHPYKLFPPSP